MKHLVFNVEGQKLSAADKIDPPIRGTKNYLVCKFNFLDDEWSKFHKICVFTHGQTESAILLKEDACTIPEEFTNLLMIKFYLVGAKDDQTIKTNTYYLRQGN